MRMGKVQHAGLLAENHAQPCWPPGEQIYGKFLGHAVPLVGLAVQIFIRGLFGCCSHRSFNVEGVMKSCACMLWYVFSLTQGSNPSPTHVDPAIP